MSETEPLKVVIIEDEKSHFFLMNRAILMKGFGLIGVNRTEKFGNPASMAIGLLR